ncbi:MAG: CHAT domain-containing protein [Mongoliibacter sp.]|uniref:CHAT domain-containing protein n=1 Tax=Mongoliibacter sp. TaxID=2022438 RepID=UPI0012F343A2|nr:CHAT domain-containing protein [Mongoliibacter sp.]TVP42969.1 MAG: CHAT domain-containing protein [Mongoliibacter sp.]
MDFLRSVLFIVFIFQFKAGFSLAQAGQEPAFWLDQVNTVNTDPALSWSEKLDKVEAIRIRFLEKNQKDGVYAKIIHRIADYKRILGDFSGAISLMQEAIAINKSDLPHAEEHYLSFTFCNIGIAYQELGIQEKAEAYYDSAFSLHKKYPEETFPPAYISFDRRTVYSFNKGEYQRTVDLLDYALGSIYGLEGTIQETLLKIKKGRALLELGEIEKADEIFQNSIGIFESDQASGELLGFAYNAYGIYLAAVDRPEEAETYFSKAMDLYLKMGYLGSVLASLDELYYTWAKKDDQKALKYLYQSREYLEPYPDSRENMSALNNIGATYTRLERYDEALEYFQQAMQIAVKGFEPENDYQNPTLAQIRQTDNYYEIAMILKNKGEALAKQFQKKKSDPQLLDHALTLYRLNDQVIDLMRWNQQSEDTKAFWRGYTKPIYEWAIQTSMEKKDFEGAFYFMEKSRAVMLNDQLSEMGALRFIHESDLYKEKEYKTDAVALKTVLLEKEAGTEDFQKATVDWFEAQSRYETFIKELEQRYPSYYQYKYDTSVLSLQRLQEEVLDHNQAYLSYFVGEEASYVLFAANDKVGLKKIEAKDLEKRAAQLIELTSNKSKINSDFVTFKTAAHSLYKELFPEEIKKYSRVVISPDGFFLPFEFLMTDPSDDNSFLLKSQALSYTYSAGFLAKNQKGYKKHSLFGLAPVDYSVEVQQASLPGADLSLKKIKSFFPKNKLLTHERATKQNFLDLLSDHSIIQLYSHAVADTEGQEPRLYFFDTSMPLSELQLLGGLPAHLIVLAACNTGVGRLVRGEGVFSLARGFAAAGIPSSITTLWEVENQATYELTELFYRFLSDGHSSDVALQQAKLEFLKKSEGQSLPYFWAGQVLVGRSDVLKPASSLGIYYLYLGIIMVLLAAVFLLYKKKKTNWKPK